MNKPLLSQITIALKYVYFPCCSVLQARIAKFAAGLAKIEDAWKCVDQFRNQVAALIPGKEKGQDGVLEHINNVEALRAQYMEVRNGENYLLMMLIMMIG